LEVDMQFGVALPHFSQLATREALVRTAREAESLGYDSVWTTDHVLMATDQPEPYGRVIEAFVSLTYIAALTERVRLGTSVIVLPQREPVLVAKQAAALDVLSGGRLILGVGAGWNEREFGFLSASFQDRGQRMNEYIGALRTLWSTPTPRFDGRYVHIADAQFEPQPAQPGGPPIWVGGGSRAALRRAATLCDGWHAVGSTVDEFAAGMRTIAELADGRTVKGSVRLRAAVGRQLPEQRGARGQAQAHLSGSPDEILEQVHAYEAAGASELMCFFGAQDLEANLDDMRRFAEQVRTRA
jgi:probable F420-dependent oxidoreductase